MLNFTPFPNCLDVGDRIKTEIAMGRNQACWKCGQTGHLALSCKEKKASVIPAAVDQIPSLPGTDSSAASTKGMPAVPSPVTSSTPGEG